MNSVAHNPHQNLIKFKSLKRTILKKQNRVTEQIWKLKIIYDTIKNKWF